MPVDDGAQPESCVGLELCAHDLGARVALGIVRPPLAARLYKPLPSSRSGSYSNGAGRWYAALSLTVTVLGGTWITLFWLSLR